MNKGMAKDFSFEQLLGSQEQIYYPNYNQDVTNKSGIKDRHFSIEKNKMSIC